MKKEDMENKYLAQLEKSAGIAGMLGATAKSMLGLGSKAVKGLGNYASDAIGGAHMNNLSRATGIKNPSALAGLGKSTFSRNKAAIKSIRKNTLTTNLTGASARQANRDAVAKIRNIPTKPVLPGISTSGSNVANAWKNMDKKNLGPEVLGSSKGMNKGVMPGLKNKLVTGRLVTGGAVVGAGVLAHKVSNKVSGNGQPQYYN